MLSSFLLGDFNFWEIAFLGTDVVFRIVNHDSKFGSKHVSREGVEVNSDLLRLETWETADCLDCLVVSACVGVKFMD